MNETFDIRRVGTAIHEITAPNGMVVGWGVDKRWSAAIALALMVLVGVYEQEQGPLLPETRADE